MCGYIPPQQNAFKPNIMSEYIILSTKEIVVFNENEERLTHPVKGDMVRLDVYNAARTNTTVPVSTTPPPPVTIAVPTPVQAVIPERPIPATMIKTPAEVAATPKASMTATAAPQPPAPVASTIPTPQQP